MQTDAVVEVLLYVERETIKYAVVPTPFTQTGILPYRLRSDALKLSGRFNTSNKEQLVSTNELFNILG